MARAKTTTPTGHGEVITQPPLAEWRELMEANTRAAASWGFTVCGTRAPELRRVARREAVSLARDVSERLGLTVAPTPVQPESLVMTGHQPELYHPGIWVKDFLLQRLSDETGATAIDLIVDSDSFDTLGIHTPCLRPDIRVCTAFLAIGGPDRCFATSPVPSADELEAFCQAGAQQLRTLPAPAIGHHWAAFCDAMRASAPVAANLAELVTGARRRYEASAGTDYLELPVTEQAGGFAFAAFVADIALRAEAFVESYNGELAAFRARTGTRSLAQPFPDLRVEGDLLELPLWDLSDRGRRTVWTRAGEHPALVVEGAGEVALPSDCADAPAAVLGGHMLLAPKALVLTMFQRMFVSDLFIHGVGGGRYDQVTDGVIRRFYGVEPLPYVVASMTMYLPLGAHVVTDEEIDSATQRLNRLRQNPDQMLGELDFDDDSEYERAMGLSARKARLVSEIAAPGADKKTLGATIRQVNVEIAGLLGTLEQEMRDDLDRLLQMREASEILTDRTYPFCLWSPLEVADKVR